MNQNSLLSLYLNHKKNEDIDSAAVSFYAGLDTIYNSSPKIAKSILKEFYDQSNNLKLIASENFSSLSVQLAQGNLLTDKYAEGYPNYRFYAGCDNIDDIESEAANTACKLFGAEHAYIQPHSGSDANLIAFIAILSAKIQQPLIEKLNTTSAQADKSEWGKIKKEFFNQKLFSLDYYSGGHLTHGYRQNFSGLLFNVKNYMVNKDNFLINLDELRTQLHEFKPLIFLAGYSSYPRKLNFAKMREMADEVGAIFMVDMSHFAGLVAGGVYTGEYDPVPYAHIVTTTTHKTLRGPRGGLILCKKEFAPWVDKGCPSVMGGPLPHVIAAKSIALKEACSQEFKDYAAKIVENSAALSDALIKEEISVVTGGSDNHLILADVDTTFSLTGRQAESALRDCGITLNRNVLPFDKNGPWYTSGIRIGTPAVTTLGMGPDEMKELAKIIKLVLKNTTPTTIQSGERQGQTSKAKYIIDEKAKIKAKKRVAQLLENFVLYPELCIDIIPKSYFE
jgi:glycine hydroxymethyltransferase